MRIVARVVGGVLLCSALGACSKSTPIVAGAVDQVGIGLSGGAQDQGGTVTIGYRGAKFAVVPVQTEAGDQLSLQTGPNSEKGFSVFAMLGVDSKGGLESRAGIAQVVAVGPAAEMWAAGLVKMTPEQAQALGIIQR